MKVAIFCANGVEECEALLVYDLLYRCELDVDLVSVADELITSSHKLSFKTNKNINDIDIKEYDCIVLPGGDPGSKNLDACLKVHEAIDYCVKENKLIAALCSAPFILVKKGLLNDNEFTCFPGCEEGKISTGEKVHQHKNIITGKGLGATIEFAGLIIKNLLGEDKQNEIYKRIQLL
ncbi:MAG: DJ-1/PfpI family protein [Erysipelotrichaceae bacterium]|nr:DJ-1/PfpI family protein [Erysipelotrichaceae bacterium]